MIATGQVEEDRHMWRRGVLPFACALTMLAALSTVLAGLSRADDTQPQPPALEQQPGESFGPDGKGTPQDGTGTQDKGATEWTGSTREQNKAAPGVGSRALTDQEARDRAADQPEMATGADLEGPPVRFSPADTPE